MIHSPNLNRREIRSGILFFLLWLFVLPTLMISLNLLLGEPLSTGALNFAFYLLSFLCSAVIFRSYLRASIRALKSTLLPALLWAGAGFLGNLAAAWLLRALFDLLFPGFVNFNDQSVIRALLDEPVWMSVGVTVLIPVTEELLFRGLLFRGLYDRSPALAWLVSVTAFAAVHVAGYLGSASPSFLLLSFLQYLPAGLCLCFVYRRSSNVFCPMLLHALINGAAILTVR